MDAFVLLGSFAVLMLIGMPVAFALGLAALIGALWINLPLDGVMIQIASGVNKFSLLAIPCFVLAGAIMPDASDPSCPGSPRTASWRVTPSRFAR